MLVAWTPEDVQSLLDTPHRMLTTDPWQAWIRAQGGLEAVYAHLLQLRLSERERQTLALLLEEPGLTNSQYAARLHVHRVTFQRLLRRLLETLAAHLTALQDPHPTYAPAPQVPPPASRPLPPVPAGSVPMPLTSLIGRAHEVALIATWVQDPISRLITLVGPGGIGKTRLAVQVAWETSADFTHGLLFVPLTSITEPTLVLPTIMRALQLADDGPDLEAPLRDYLTPRRMCLVLDNAEHLLAAMPLLGRLLTAAPRLTILVTSRVRLGLYGERLMEVPPLNVPPLHASGSIEAVCAADAVRLFAARPRPSALTLP